MTWSVASEAGLALELLVTVLGRGAALVTAAWLATRLVTSADARRTAWIALFVALAATPLLVHRPAWISMEVGESPVPGVSASAEAVEARTSATSATVPPARIAAPVEPYEPAAAGREPGDSLPGARLVLVVWLVGALALLVRTLASRRTLAAVASSGDAPGGRLAAIVRSEVERAGLERPVRVVLTDRLAVPASWGDRRPVVALPIDAERWPSDRARVVLRHELTHVRRRDALVLGLARLVRALYWPNPLVWWAVGRARDLQEEACDVEVLGTGVANVDYARHLVDVARACAARARRTPEAALTIGARERLERRVRSILALRPTEARRGVAIAAVAALLLVTAPVTGVRVEPIDSVPPLLTALDDVDPVVRERAIVALGELADRRAFYDLKPIALAGEGDLAPAAVWALGRIQCFPGIDVLGDVLAGAVDPRVRSTAARGLHGAPAAVAASPLAAALRSDPDPAVRREAAVALGRLAFGEGAFRGALAREAATVRRRAAHLAHRSGPELALAALRDAADDRDPRVRTAAARSVDAIETSTS